MPETSTPTAVPVVYLNVFEGNGSSEWEACKSADCPPFVLVAIGGLDWNCDMTPWQSKSVFKGGGDFGGKAREHLLYIEESVIPFVEKTLSRQCGLQSAFSAIAGYSLAGLFASWTAFQSVPFTRFASASGSLWFPLFLDYAKENPFQKNPDRFYLSLGDAEEKAKNPVMASVGDCTRGFAKVLEERKIKSILEMNPGNHFKDPDLRIAKGIKWILEE